MKKQLTGIMILLLSGSVISSGCNSYGNHTDRQKTAHDASSHKPNKDNSGKQGQSTSFSVLHLSGEQIVRQVAASAKKGQLTDSPFTVSQTSFKTVEKDWGKPNSMAKTPEGVYATYKSREKKVGFTSRRGIVDDLRSYSDQIHSVSLSEIKKVLGKPNQVRYFKDSKVDQEILNYHLNNDYELKWVLSKPGRGNSNPYVDHISIVANNNADELLNKMTLDEKIGQMLLIGITNEQEADQFIKQEHVGGVILYGSNILHPDQTVKLINQLKNDNKTAANPLPLMVSTDQEGGEVQRLPNEIHGIPSNGKIGKIDDPKFSYQIGQIIGKELKDFGFNVDFAPVFDITTLGKNSIIGSRSFGSNKKTVSRLGIATMHGIQSQQVISVVKHFPGYGAVRTDAHKVLPTVNESMSELMNVQWYPYENAIGNGAEAVMVTHMVIPSLDPRYPASMSHAVITGMLRKKLGYNGVVFTDDMTMGAIEKHFNINNAAVQLLKQVLTLYW